MSVQDQYTDTVRQTQEAWSGAVETWTSGVQKAFGASPVVPFRSPDPVATIDQLFDFAEKALQVQREFVKNLVSATASVGQAVRHQAESTGDAVRTQTESTGRLIREHNDAVAQAATDQIADKYGDKTKAELQDELGRRDLPKTGNVEELRSRLVEADQK